jgi:sugar phosphate isomerase/epimerase
MEAAEGPHADGYAYPHGVPTKLPQELLATHVPVAAFEGELPPPPRVSPSVRAAWAEALAELEARNEKRVGAQVAAGVGGGLIIGGAAAAMLCTVQ